MYPVGLRRTVADLYCEDRRSRPGIGAFLEEDLGVHAFPRAPATEPPERDCEAIRRVRGRIGGLHASFGNLRGW